MTLKEKPVKIGLDTYSAFTPEKVRVRFDHYLNEKDEAIVTDSDLNVMFTFDIDARMFNSKGTFVGTIRLEDLGSAKWAFYVANFDNGKLVSEKVLDLRAKYPFNGEPEIIKWLIETGKLEDYLTK